MIGPLGPDSSCRKSVPPEGDGAGEPALRVSDAHGQKAVRKFMKCLTYQLGTVVYWTTMVLTGDGESGFYSGEAALKTATTPKGGSRRANYPILDV